MLLDSYKTSPTTEQIHEEDFPQKPTTSWIIRTYNEEKWLGKVLSALFIQSRLDFEVIIIDSGSTDKSLEIIKHFPIRKTIEIRQEEYNPSYTLNLGAREAWGDYIGILSGHSIPVSRTWYANGLKNLSNKKVAGVTGHYHALPDAHPREKLGDLFADWGKESKKEHHYKSMTNTNSIIRKSCWEEYNFDENLEGCEDYDWGCEMVARGYDIIKDPAFNVYHSHGGLGRPVYEERIKRWERICAEIDKKQRPSI